MEGITKSEKRAARRKRMLYRILVSKLVSLVQFGKKHAPLAKRTLVSSASFNTGQPRLKGILWKQGGGRSLFGQANWKKRYCVIIGDNLFYYVNRQAYITNQRHLKKPYRLQDCDVHFVSVTKEAETSHDIQKHRSKSRQPAFYFTIQPRNSEMRALHLRAATLAERDEWVRNIREVEVSNMLNLLQDNVPANRLDAARSLVRLAGNLNNADTILRLKGVEKLVDLAEKTPLKSEGMLVSACLQALRRLCRHRHTGVDLELRRLDWERRLFELVLRLLLFKLKSETLR